MSNTVKTKFAGFLRGLLRRFDDSDATAVATPHPDAATPPRHRLLPHQLSPTARRRTDSAAPTSRLRAPPAATPQLKPQSKPQPVSTPPAVAPAASSGDLRLPLSSIIAVLPMDLRAKVIQTPPADVFVSIPVEQALSQLAHGSVKISFGELRAAAPQFV